MKAEQKRSRGRPAMATRLETNGKSGTGSTQTVVLINQLLDQTCPPTRCPLCDHQGNTRTGTEAHYREHHKGQNGYICMDTTCGQGFSSRPGLQYHLRAAHSFTKVKDSIIITTLKHKQSKTTRRGTKLTDDMASRLSAHYDPLICPGCKATFSKKTQTLQHVNTSHPKEKLFHCFIANCRHDQGFGSLQALVYHLSKHEE